MFKTDEAGSLSVTKQSSAFSPILLSISVDDSGDPAAAGVDDWEDSPRIP